MQSLLSDGFHSEGLRDLLEVLSNMMLFCVEF